MSAAAPTSNWIDRLGEKTTPHFGQLITWLLLATCVLLAGMPLQGHVGPRQGPCSLLSWLPEEALGSASLSHFFRAILILGTLGWLAGKWLRISCWLTVIGFTCLWGLHVENVWHSSHCFHLANNLLFIQALWVTLYADEIQSSRATGTYWTTPLYPRWVSLGGIAFIGLFHSAAGISKIATSGLGWANGVSLQLWTYMDGRPWSPSTQFITSHYEVTLVMQAATLIFETLAIMAIFPRFRTIIGLALSFFYVGVLVTFDYGFQLNLLFTALYLLPVEWWLNKRVARRSTILTA